MKAKPQNIEHANFEGRKKTKESAFDVRAQVSFSNGVGVPGPTNLYPR